MKRKIFKKILAFTMSLLILSSGMNISMAAQTTETKGSLTVVYKCGGNKTSGVKAKLFRVGNSSNGVFTLAGDFINAPVNLVGVDTNEKWEAIALALEKYANSNSLTPLATGTSNNSGEIVFGELATGLYLVLSEKDSDSRYNYKFEPSVVSIPSKDAEGNWIYNVTIYPKCEREEKPTCPTCPTEPTKPTTPTSPTVPTEPTKPTAPTSPTEPTKPIPTKPTTRPTKPTKPGKPWVPSLPSTGMVNMVAYSMVGIGIVGLGVWTFKKKDKDDK